MQVNVLSASTVEHVNGCADMDPSRVILERIIKESDALNDAPELAVGVLVLDGEFLKIRLKNQVELRQFSLAASCLLKPNAGDLVSCLCLGKNIWVQHILSRTGELIEAPLSIKDGHVSIEARCISISADTDLKLSADVLTQRTRTTREQCGDRYSDVTGMRMESSKNLMVRVAKHANVKADSLTQVAVSLMKLDGSQIHMG